LPLSYKCSTSRLATAPHAAFATIAIISSASCTLAAVLAALVAMGPARADDLSEDERKLCRDSADMASRVSRDLLTAPTTMPVYQSYCDALLKILTREIDMLRARHCPQADEAADKAASTMLRIAITAKSLGGN
jgi:hypothetical protein